MRFHHRKRGKATLSTAARASRPSRYLDSAVRTEAPALLERQAARCAAAFDGGARAPAPRAGGELRFERSTAARTGRRPWRRVAREDVDDHGDEVAAKREQGPEKRAFQATAARIAQHPRGRGNQNRGEQERSDDRARDSRDPERAAGTDEHEHQHNSKRQSAALAEPIIQGSPKWIEHGGDLERPAGSHGARVPQ